MRERFERCVIVGTGLIGASLGGAGKKRGLFSHVVGCGRSIENLKLAEQRGLIDEARTDTFKALEGADLVVVATPVFTAVSQLHELAEHAPETAVFTDVGSVKQPILTEARRRGLVSRFIGAHPLAGKAETGAAAADADLFRGRRVVLTPEADTPAELVAEMQHLWTSVEAEVSVMEAADHDAVLATSSHLPQMIAFALAATADAAVMRDEVVKLIAGGFRDTTRLSSSDAAMWIDIARLNREAIVDAMDEFSMVWDDLRDAVADRDDAAMRTIIMASQKLRREIAG
ncbi:MAG TPA: prephenate dehydrogenase/arogenate dehydrogenase family protein [Candidatus Limnocylindrales bacterium]|nr:prephenate dehydrogenase/arogenate dehydrogenase family protein [Candidatus Limnocylindrales bacterium]